MITRSLRNSFPSSCVSFYFDRITRAASEFFPRSVIVIDRAKIRSLASDIFSLSFSPFLLQQREGYWNIKTEVYLNLIKDLFFFFFFWRRRKRETQLFSKREIKRNIFIVFVFLSLSKIEFVAQEREIQRERRILRIKISAFCFEQRGYARFASSIADSLNTWNLCCTEEIKT